MSCWIESAPAQVTRGGFELIMLRRQPPSWEGSGLTGGPSTCGKLKRPLRASRDPFDRGQIPKRTTSNGWSTSWGLRRQRPGDLLQGRQPRARPEAGAPPCRLGGETRRELGGDRPQRGGEDEPP